MKYAGYVCFVKKKWGLHSTFQYKLDYLWNKIHKQKRDFWYVSWQNFDTHCLGYADGLWNNRDWTVIVPEIVSDVRALADRKVLCFVICHTAWPAVLMLRQFLLTQYYYYFRRPPTNHLQCRQIADADSVDYAERIRCLVDSHRWNYCCSIWTTTICRWCSGTR